MPTNTLILLSEIEFGVIALHASGLFLNYSMLNFFFHALHFLPDMIFCKSSALNTSDEIMEYCMYNLSIKFGKSRNVEDVML